MERRLFHFVMPLLVLFVVASCSTSSEKGDKGKYNEVIENIFERKSVRSYQEKSISRDTLELLVRAGMAAPSAMNRQPWNFFVSTERAKMDSLSGKLPYAKMLSESAAVIVVLGSEEISKLWVYDCCAAVENILLAAESMGLGAVWTAAHPFEERMDAIREVYSIPSQWSPLALIPVGYPNGEHKPKEKWDPEKVHFESWN